MAASKDNSNSGLMLVITFFALFVVNSVVLYLANTLFPQWVVLGTISATWLWAIILSMGALSLLDTFVIPLVAEWEKSQKRVFSSMEWMGLYFLVNLAGVWVIARFSDQFGFGIRSWLVAVGLAVVLDLVQGVVMMQLQKVKDKLI